MSTPYFGEEIFQKFSPDDARLARDYVNERLGECAVTHRR